MNPARAACSKPPNAARTPTGSAGIREPGESGLGREGAWPGRGRPPRSSSRRWRRRCRCRGRSPRRVGAGEGADQRGGRGGVGDAHVAGDQAPVARRDQVAGDLGAGHQRAMAWSRVIAGPSVKSAVPRRDLAGQQPGDRLEVGGHPHVDHRDLGAGLRRERVDHRPAGQEVGDHLGGHLLRPRADPLRVHAVVGGEHRDAGRLGQRRRAAARQPGQPDGHLLEHAERAARLGHPVLPFPCGGHRLGVGRGDRRDQVGERVHWCLPWHSAVAELLGVHRPRHRPAARPAGRGSSGSAANEVT